MEASPVTLFLALLFLVLSFKFVFQNRRPKLNLPPSPPKLPIIGHLHLVGKMSHISFKHLTDKLGPIIHLQFGGIPIVIVSSADMAKEVMKTHDQVTASRPELYSPKHLLYNCSDIGFSPYGAHFKYARRITVAELLSPSKVQSYEGIRKEQVSHLVQRIEASCHSPVNLSKLLRLYIYDGLFRVITGKHFSEEAFDEFTGMLIAFAQGLGSFSFRDFFPSLEFLDVLVGHKSKLEKTSQRFDNFLNDIIKQHQDSMKENSKGKDFVEVLLNIQKNGGGDMALTMTDVKAILISMFAAGLDTTIFILDWAMTELFLSPSLMNRAQAEVRSIVGEKKIVSESDLLQMQYMKAIIKETLRLHPPAPLALPREVAEDVIIGGYDIPAKTRIFVDVWAIGRDSKVWKDSDIFNPDRFIGNDNIDVKGQNYELLPFGAGRRICPGLTFAIVTMELGLAQLLHSFDWELPPGVQPKDLDISEICNVLVARATDLVVMAKPHFA
ncbi:hypothetical protein Ancab_040390 [Ancistrocladus abbreviatus]